MATAEASTYMVPNRSRQQRLDALERANEVRSRRAGIKRDLTAGRVSLPDLLESPPDWLEGAKVMDLLLATPKYGRVKATMCLKHASVSPTKTVAGMTDRQRAEVIAILRSR